MPGLSGQLSNDNNVAREKNDATTKMGGRSGGTAFRSAVLAVHEVLGR